MVDNITTVKNSNTIYIKRNIFIGAALQGGGVGGVLSHSDLLRDMMFRNIIPQIKRAERRMIDIFAGVKRYVEFRLFG